MIFHVPVALNFKRRKGLVFKYLQFLYIAGSGGQP